MPLQNELLKIVTIKGTLCKKLNQKCNSQYPPKYRIYKTLHSFLSPPPCHHVENENILLIIREPLTESTPCYTKPLFLEI